MNEQDVIPQTSPLAGYQQHKQAIDAAVARVLQSGWYILGKELVSFEKQLADYFGISHAIGVANGTDAIELALRALEVGPGDGVLTVSHTAVATVSAIERTGATPVLVDIDPARYTMCPKDLARAIGDSTRLAGSKPKAIVPVHLYGQMADMDAILKIAKANELYVVEDCAQAHGAMLGSAKAGTLGDIAAMSFYPTKNLGALGDGGAVVTNQETLAARVKSIREYGWEERYISARAGVNSRLDEIQAAILAVRLSSLDADNARRREIAMTYDKQLALCDGITLPALWPEATHVYHQYVIELDDRDAARQYLSSQGIHTGVHYPVPVHLQPAYRGRLGDQGSLPATEAAAGRILSLPMFPQLTDAQAMRVTQGVISWFSSRGNK